jgi:hypothetical protein
MIGKAAIHLRPYIRLIDNLAEKKQTNIFVQEEKNAPSQVYPSTSTWKQCSNMQALFLHLDIVAGEDTGSRAYHSSPVNTVSMHSCG